MNADVESAQVVATVVESAVHLEVFECRQMVESLAAANVVRVDDCHTGGRHTHRHSLVLAAGAAHKRLAAALNPIFYVL